MARRAPFSLIDGIRPMLLSERPLGFDLPGWIYEIKFDGYRLLAEFGSGRCALRSKTGADATAWFPEVARSLAAVPGGPHIADGEVCVLDDIGRSDFDRLHARARRRRWYEGADPVTFCAFDVVVRNGESLLTAPLMERKANLVPLLGKLKSVLVIQHFDHGSEDVFNQGVLGLGLEGLVAKRAVSPYLPGVRSPDWVKIKRKGAVPAGRFSRRAAI